MGAREELRLAEERVARLRAETARLHHSLVKPTGARKWTLAALLAAAVMGTGGFMVAKRNADQRSALESASAAKDYGFDWERHRSDTEGCKQVARRTVLRLASCRKAQADAPPPSPAHHSRPGPRCMCEPGDPLCSCL